jgi:PLP dependent protein
MSENFEKILQTIRPTKARLVAVSKTKPSEQILELYAKNQRIFGENYVQDLVDKQATLPSDIEWHFIGHLQSNKVKYIAPFVAMIHAVDSLKLLQEIDKQAAKQGRTIRCLLQFHIAAETTKFGFDAETCLDMLHSAAFRSLKNIQICGVMGMATFTDNKAQVRAEFQSLKRAFDEIKADFFQDQSSFCEISMGMSDDYELAIAEGSTLIRIGSLLFGKRN